MNKHSNVAIFVPHNGCPHCCSFCDQKSITGQSRQPDENDVRRSAKIAVDSLGENSKNAEIAFFGGSFTAIDRDYMLSLLNAANEFIPKFKGIRISTRPDYIDEEVLTLLKSKNVTSIELGVQSLSDEVLKANNRGHTADCVYKSAELIKSFGFSLGLQMMTGLYKSDEAAERFTASEFIRLKPDTVRIYPTAVMKNTELERLYLSGKYSPPDLEQSVRLCAELLRLFEENGVKVIRLGLHDGEALKSNVIAGVYHPSFRELCCAELFYKDITAQIQSFGNAEAFDVYVNPRDISKAVGQKKSNLIRFEQDGCSVRLIQDETVNINSVQVKPR